MTQLLRQDCLFNLRFVFILFFSENNFIVLGNWGRLYIHTTEIDLIPYIDLITTE